MCSWRAHSQSCCQLGKPRDFACLSGGQLRPTDRAMAARSARTSSSEEDARSTDEDRSLRVAVEKHFAGRKHLFESEKTSV